MNILAIIQAVAALIKLVIDVVGLAKQAKKNGWLADGKAIMAKVKEAKNDEERARLAKKIANHIGAKPAHFR